MKYRDTIKNLRRILHFDKCSAGDRIEIGGRFYIYNKAMSYHDVKNVVSIYFARHKPKGVRYYFEEQKEPYTIFNIVEKE